MVLVPGVGGRRLEPGGPEDGGEDLHRVAGLLPRQAVGARAVYARRKAIVEPVFGQIHTRQGKHVLLRGLGQAQDEWNVLAGCHNLMKLFTMRTNALLAAPAGT